MTVGIRLGFKKLTLKDYDAICVALKFPAEWPEGLRSHSSHETNGHLVVNDVWETRQDFDRFVETKLGPSMGKALGDGGEQPEVAETRLHTFHKR